MQKVITFQILHWLDSTSLIRFSIKITKIYAKCEIQRLSKREDREIDIRAGKSFKLK
ncbi:MAG TPA: hypothetical protein VIY08_14905 [Candidatus Nitrosocosmicus sp.]